jgi:excisionase family DNA binding protein
MSLAEIIASDPKLTEDQAAEMLGVKSQTLSVWRCAKRYSLPYIKCGRLVRYRLSDVEKFLARRTVGAVAD